MEYLSATHAFDYIVLRINPSLTTCKNLAMMVDNSLDKLVPVTLAIFYHIDIMPGTINLYFYCSHAYYHIA